jgi:hypothetical protein
MATIPIIYNKWISNPDTTWFTPVLIFHKKVLGDGIVDEATLLDLLHQHTSRITTPSEIRLLQKIAFIGNDNTPLLMIKVDDLAHTLQQMNKQGLAATVACLKDMPPMEGTSSPNNHTFPHNIPQCSIGEEDLKGDYSLSATAPHLCEEGTKWALQLAALEKAKNGKCLPWVPWLLACLPFLLASLACFSSLPPLKQHGHCPSCCRPTHHQPWQGHQGQ